MEQLTPTQLLRFLEEESTTLGVMYSKISNQLHCLKVEEELFNRQLLNLEKVAAVANDVTRNAIIQVTEIGREDDLNILKEFESQVVGKELSNPHGSSERVPVSSPVLEYPTTEKSSEGDIQETSESMEIRSKEALEVKLQTGFFAQELSSPPKTSAAFRRVKNAARKTTVARKTTSSRQERSEIIHLENEGNFEMEVGEKNQDKESTTIIPTTRPVGVAKASSLSLKRKARRPSRYE